MFRLSIKRKQMLIILLTSSVALLLASGAFILHEWMTFRENLKENLSSQAGLLGENCTAALLFNDPRVAKEVIQSLGKEPNVMVGLVLTRRGELFASYVRGRPGEVVAPLPAKPVEGYEVGEDF